MSDLISKQDAVEELRGYFIKPNISDDESEIKGYNDGLNTAITVISTMPSAQLPSYVEEIEEEYQKAVNAEWIHKPLAKALYEVWKKHDREDVSRHESN